VFVKVVLAIRHDGCFTQRLAGSARMTQISSDREREILVLRAAEPEVDAFLAWLRETRARVDVIERAPGLVVVHTTILPNGVIPTIVSQGCTILWPATFSEGLERYNVLAPSRAALERLARHLERLGEVRVEWLADVPIDALDVIGSPLTDVVASFTRKQMDVLRAAIERGYYETPRRVSVAALADEFGLAPSTFDEHLRKAERRLLERFATGLRSTPQLQAAAATKPGRPRKVREPQRASRVPRS
jgi:predicted DNA binding protein